MSDIDKAREEYKHALRSTYVSRDADECGRTYGLVDEDKADVLIAALEAEVERLKADLRFITNYTTGERERKARKRAEAAEAERDRLAWMLERIRDSEYDRMSDADALADLAARYDARHEGGDG